MRNRQAVWIVEMLVSRRWAATVGVSLNRDEGRRCVREWQRRNPDDLFRLVRYRP